jgi:hypothetical protein
MPPSVRRRTGLLLVAGQVAVITATLGAQPRVSPGSYAGWYVSRLNASPLHDESDTPPPRWLPHNFNAAARSYYHARAAMLPAQRAAWDAQATAIVEFLRQAPVLSRKFGHDFEPSSSTGIVRQEHFGPGGMRTAMFSGGVTIGAFRKSDVVALADGSLKTGRGAHAPHFSLTFNEIPAPAAEAWTRDSAGLFFLDKPEGFIDGMPMYGGALLLTRNNRSPFVPVSVERALKAFVASYVGSDTSKASARALLASLGPEARKAPAWVCDDQSRISSEPCLRPANSRNAVPLKAIDPNFFDKSLPRHVLQIISVDNLSKVAKGSETEERNSAFAINLAIFQQTDWKSLRDRFVK